MQAGSLCHFLGKPVESVFMLSIEVIPPIANAGAALAGVTDEELVQRFQEETCSESLSELVGRHLSRVRSLAFSMILNDATADDVAQEVFCRAIRGLPNFRRDAQFSTWLYRITWNVIQDALQRSKRTVSDANEVWLRQLTDDNVPSDDLVRHETQQQVTAALAQLSPTLRAAMVLTSLQGLSGEEAATLEGCTVGTMYWRIHEARKQLQARLKKYVSEE